MNAIDRIQSSGRGVENVAKTHTPIHRLAALRLATARVARLVNAPPSNPRAAIRAQVDAMRKGAGK